ncbi:hypothetical protein ACFL06_01635, partial [Patescibacteria group bacterium]
VRRTHDLKQIASAIQQNVIDGKGTFTCDPIPDCTSGAAIIGSNTGAGEYNLCPCVVPLYLPVMPVDPQSGSWTDCGNYNTQYDICSASLELGAPHTQEIAGVQDEKIVLIVPGDFETVPTGPSFTLSLIPNSSTVAPGASASAIVNITGTGGFAGDVTISASDPDPTIDVTFDDPDDTCIPDCSIIMDIDTDVLTPTSPPTYTITVTGQSGAITRQSNYTLTVAGAPVSGFTVLVNPTEGTVEQGESTTTDVTVSAFGGFSDSVTLSAAPLSGGSEMTIDFPSGNSCTPAPDCTLLMSISTTTGISIGSFLIRVSGTGGGYTAPVTNYILYTEPRVVDLFVDLDVNPTSGDAPIDIDLISTVSGTAEGTVNFAFHCDAENPPAVWEHTYSGIRAINLDNVDGGPTDRVDDQLHSHSTEVLSGGVFAVYDLCNYTIAGTYYPRVRAQRDTAPDAQDVYTLTLGGPEPDFSISANPTTIRKPRTGWSEVSVIRIDSIENYNSEVDLSVSDTNPPISLAEQFVPPSVTPPAGGSATSNMDVWNSGVSSPGTYILTVRGDDGAGKVHETNVTLEVMDLSQTLIANPLFGSPPLNVTLTSNVVLENATGDITYRYDCDDDGNWEHTFEGSSTSHPEVCTYTFGGYQTARVRAELTSYPAVYDEDTVTIDVAGDYPVWQSPGCGYGDPISCTGDAAILFGYKFIPDVSGQVTKLCGYFPGTNVPVSLYNSSFMRMGNPVSITSSPHWECQPITPGPQNVQVGQLYYVIIDDTSPTGVCRRQNLDPELSKDCGDIKIQASVYDSTNPLGGFDSPVDVIDTMYGMVDIWFEP